MPTATGVLSGTRTVLCYFGNQAAVFNGTGTRNMLNSETLFSGENKISTNWVNYEGFWQFTEVPATGRVISGSFTLTGNLSWVNGPHNMYVVPSGIDGSSLSHYRTSATLAAMTPVATGNWVFGEMVLTIDADEMNAQMNKGGTTYLLMACQDYADQVWGGDYGEAYTNTTSTGSANYPVYEIVWQYGQPLSGSLSLSGNSVKKLFKSLSGSTGSFSGSMLTGIGYFKSLSGSVGNLTGSLSIRIGKSLEGIITNSGGLVKRITKSFSGAPASISAALTPVRVFPRALTGAMGTLSGSISSRQNGFGKSLSGSFNATGALSRLVKKRLIGAVSGQGKTTIRATVKNVIMRAGNPIIRKISGGTGN